MAFALIMHGVAAWITAKRLEAERSSASGRQSSSVAGCGSAAI